VAARARGGTMSEDFFHTNLGRYQDSKHLHFHVNSGDPLR
jgi:hypothetical protein